MLRPVHRAAAALAAAVLVPSALAFAPAALAGGVYAEVLAPNGKVIATGSGERFDFPADGSLVHVGRADTSGAGVTLTDVAAAGWVLQAAELRMPAGRRSAMGGIVAAAGRLVRPRPNTLVPLGTGYAVLDQRARSRGRIGRVGLRIVLEHAAFGQPAGTQVVLGVPRRPVRDVTSAARDPRGRLDPLAVLGFASGDATLLGLAAPSTVSGSIGERAATIAQQFLGVPYVWGGADPVTGFDCSGLALYVYSRLGISLTHYSGAQFNQGLRVPESELQPGDLVFFEWAAGRGPAARGDLHRRRPLRARAAHGRRRPDLEPRRARRGGSSSSAPCGRTARRRPVVESRRDGVRARRRLPRRPVSDRHGAARRAAARGDRSHGELVTAAIREHLAVDVSELPVHGEELPSFELANLQVGLDAALARPGYGARVLGLAGPGRHFSDVSLAELLTESRFRIGPPEYVHAPIAPGRTLACLAWGLVLVTAPAGPLVVFVRRGEEHGPVQGLMVQAVAREPDAAPRFLADLRRLMDEHDVFRGQVITLEADRRGGRRVVFLERPHLGRDELVLPDGLLDRVERHVVAPTSHRAELLARAGTSAAGSSSGARRAPARPTPSAT